MADVKSRKKIGFIGWWAGRNIGDEYIQFCLRKAFGDEFKIKFIETSFEPNFWNLRNINSLDFLIIGGGGLFTKSPFFPFSHFNDWGHRLKVSFGFLGVGVQEISDKYKSVMRQLIERSAFFVVRDTGSFNLVNSLSPSSKILKAPDLTFLYPYQVQRKTAQDKIGVNLRVWNFDQERTYDNGQWSQAINRLNKAKKPIPLSFKKGLDDRDALRGIEGTKNDTFCIGLYEDVAVMVGMRLHSLIFAAQNSIPVIGIAYTPKIPRFFSDLNLPEFCLKVSEYSRLESVFSEALERSREIGSILAHYTRNAEQLLKARIEDIKNQIKNSPS
ncbi:MAG: polysaccharide pyruvyl transferase family protein [Candidatus Omnitrophota bacterium]|nr:MAG: polysaccharide pyruvyl transferase family protein [Candidatus Omnitrophota bacterium]